MLIPNSNDKDKDLIIGNGSIESEEIIKIMESLRSNLLGCLDIPPSKIMGNNDNFYLCPYTYTRRSNLNQT